MLTKLTMSVEFKTSTKLVDHYY